MGREIADGSQSDGIANLRLLSQHQTATYLGVSYWTVRGLINRGDLPAVRIGRRLLIDRQDIDRFIEANKRQEEPL